MTGHRAERSARRALWRRGVGGDRRRQRERAWQIPNVGVVIGCAALATATTGAVLEQPAPRRHHHLVAEAHSVPDAPRITQYRRERLQRLQIARSARRASRSQDRTQLAAQAEHAATARAAALEALEERAEARSSRLHEILEERAEARARRRWLNRWVAPLGGYEITATFGADSGLWSSAHTGLDLAAAEGTPVGAVSRGTVTFAGYDREYGYKVEVTHPDGTQTWYAHMSSISVVSGEQIGPGSVVGAVGATGNVTGEHLHLEVRPGGGAPVDPYTVLQDHGVDL